MSNGTSIAVSNFVLGSALGIESEWHLKNNYFLIDALYFTAFLEYFVLYDELVIHVEPELDDSKANQQGYDLMNLHLRFERGELSEEEMHEKENSILSRDVISHEDLISTKMINSELFNGFVDDRKLIRFKHTSHESRLDEVVDVMQELESEGLDNDPYIAMKLLDIRDSFTSGLSYVPDYSSATTAAIELARSQQEMYRKNQLKAAYDRLSNRLGKEVLDLLHQRGVMSIYIPPIPAIILSRAESMEDVAKEAWAMRDELAEVKATFAAYEDTINDDSLSLKESLMAMGELKRKMDIICGNADDSVVLNVSEWKDIADLSRLADGVIDQSDTPSLLKLFLGKPAELASRKLMTRNVSYLAEIKKEFLEIRNYGKLLQNIFKREISNEDFALLESSGVGSGFK